MGVLDVWGVDDEQEATYRALLRNPGHDTAALAAHLDRAEDQVRRAGEALVRAGLARHTEEGRYVAGPPAVTLAALVHSELSDLEERRSRLDAVRASLTSFGADHVVGQSRGWSSAPFELLSDEESFVAVEDLQRATTGEVLTCHPVVDIDVDPPAFIELVRRQLAAGRPMRALYPSDVVDDPRRLDYVRRWSVAGEQIRLLPQAPPSMAIFGSDVAVVSSRWDGASEGTYVVHAPAIVAIVRELFERYWEHAMPLSRISESTADGSAQILELLMLGAKDESIARQLGVSLRTVRRRVADVMEDLGATTRFQAGMEAVRRGLL